MKIVRNFQHISTKVKSDQLTLNDLETYVLQYFNHPGFTVNGVRRTVNKVSWKAYTPYFNDGDLCEYSVRDTQIHITPYIFDNDDDSLLSCFDTGTIYTYNLLYRNTSFSRISSEPPTWGDNTHIVHQDTFIPIETIGVDRFEDVFFYEFGDHCEVTATLENSELVFTVEEYEHD